MLLMNASNQRGKRNHVVGLFPGEQARMVWISDRASTVMALDEAIEWLQRNEECYRVMAARQLGELLRKGCWLRTANAWFHYLHRER
jgi:hypothetical protein